jgi:putative ABC transport system permease protein
MLLSPRWNKVFRDLWLNKLRTALVVLAVAAGVFAFGVVEISRTILKRELNTVYQATNPASIVMTLSPFDDDLVNSVAGMREVAQAEGRVVKAVSMRLNAEQWIGLELYGVDFDDVAISTFTSHSGKWPPGRRELLLERAILRIPGYTLPAVAHIELPDGRRCELQVAGTVHDVVQFPTHYFREAYGYTSLETIEWLTGSRLYNRLYIVVAENADDKEAIEDTASDIQERIERGGYIVFNTSVPEPGEHWNSYAYDGVVAILAVLGVFSLLLSAFLVINTITAILKQQVRQVGMMKAVGARRGQIAAIYLISTLAYGLLSLVLAIPGSMLVARAFTDWAASLTNYDILHFQIKPSVIVVQVSLAVLVPLLSSLFPILGGARMTIHKALSDYGIRQEDVIQNLVDRLIHRVRGLPRPLLLSLRNTFRRKGRLALTLLTLSLAGAVFIAILSMRQAVASTFEDLMSMWNYDVGITLSEPMPTRLVEREARRVPGVVDAEGWDVAVVNVVREDGSEGTTLVFNAVPPDSTFTGRAITEGRWLNSDVSNEVVVSGNLLVDEPETALGEEVIFKAGDVEESWVIVGILPTMSDTEGGSGVAFANGAYYDRVAGTSVTSTMVGIKTEQHDMDTQYRVLREVEDHFKQVGIGIESSSTIQQIRAGADITMSALMALMLSMAFLLAAVGGLGLTGTLSLNVIERTREIGVMRAVGASNRSIRGMVVVEGVLIGLISVLLGALLAIPLSKVLVDVLGIVMMGEPLDYAYSVPGVLIWLALAVVLGAVSSVLPARRAAQISVREALAYE